MDRVLLAEGREAEVFLQPDGTVLKLLREASYAPRVEREVAALRALADAGLHVPRVHGVITVDGRPGLITDRIEGTDLIAQSGPNLRTLDRIAKAMAEAHAAMHEVTAPATLPDLKDALRERIEAAELLPEDLRRRSLDVLATLPAGDRVCHGDLHPGNMLGSIEAPVVIDWGNATRGDPLADVVRTALLLRIGEPPAGAPAFIRRVARAGGGLASGRYVGHYRRARPIDTALFSRWRAVRAAARLDERIPEENDRLLRLVRRDLGLSRG